MKHTENDLENICCNYAREHNIIAVKLEKNGHTGIPDRVFIKRGGGSIFVEFKKPGGGGIISMYQNYFSNFLSPNFFIVDNFINFVSIIKNFDYEE